jgi:hypothetical protein
MFGEIDRTEDPLIGEVIFFRRGLNTLSGRSVWLGGRIGENVLVSLES